MAAAKTSSRDPSYRLARGPMTIASLTAKVTRPILGKRGFVGADIVAHWASIVGNELAAFACPLEVKYPRGRNAGATLVLRVASGAAATLLQMKSPAIIARVNQFFGYAAIAQVQAVQGPLPAPMKRVEPAIASEVPTSVSAALAKLGEALQRKAARDVKIQA
jgi:hypothetical protein